MVEMNTHGSDRPNQLPTAEAQDPAAGLRAEAFDKPKFSEADALAAVNGLVNKARVHEHHWDDPAQIAVATDVYENPSRLVIKMGTSSIPVSLGKAEPGALEVPPEWLSRNAKGIVTIKPEFEKQCLNRFERALSPEEEAARRIRQEYGIKTKTIPADLREQLNDETEELREAAGLAPRNSRRAALEGDPLALEDLGITTTAKGAEVLPETHLTPTEIDQIRQMREALEKRTDLTDREKIDAALLADVERHLAEPSSENKGWVKEIREAIRESKAKGTLLGVAMLVTAALKLMGPQSVGDESRAKFGPEK